MVFFKAYSTLVAKSPYVTNCLTGFLVAGTGDLLSQKYFEQAAKPKGKGKAVTSGFSWDSSRSLDMAVIRAAVITPFVLQWYPFLIRACPGTNPLRVAGRIVLDQLVGSPVVICLVFAASALLNNEAHSISTRIREQFFVTWTTGLQYWPIVHSITFGLVPLAQQPLFTHVASVYWNAVLSYYSNLDKDNNATQAITSESRR